MSDTHPEEKTPDDNDFPTFFKYCSDDERVLKGIFEDRKIRFTQPAALNDPLEFNPIIRFVNDWDNYRRFIIDQMKFPSEEERLRAGLIENRVNAHGILSLTKVPDSFEMWSRYANGHKGFLLEVEPDFNEHECMLSKDGSEYPIREVTYVEEYAINMGELADAQGWIAQERVNEILFFTKTSRWKDEKEYRMVRDLSDDSGWKAKGATYHRDQDGIYLFDFSLDCIESVTCGAFMPVEKKSKIMDACQGSGIQFLQAIIIRDEKDSEDKPGKVRLIPIDQFSDFLGMAYFITEKKYIEEQKKPPIPLNSLAGLPYYRDNPEWVHGFIENRKRRLAAGGDTESS
ncbi:MAG: DUF2971 domain-containing protein [Sedimentisphaerales bacterium]|nr:DUF2971 domain-containing protein [Sedimentisphaerales bacterium]